MPASLIEKVSFWRSNFHYNFKGEITRSHPLDNLFNVLNNQFDVAAIKPSQRLIKAGEDLDSFADGMNALKELTILRAEQIMQALSPKSAIVRPRVAQMGTVLARSNFHIDRDNPDVDLRFLDAIDCPSTMLVSNDHIRLDEKDIPWFKYAGAVPTVECPPNSLVLITQPRHEHQAVCHSESFVVSPSDEQARRSVVTYDLCM